MKVSAETAKAILDAKPDWNGPGVLEVRVTPTVTRAGARLARELDQGSVAELVRPSKSGRPSRRYVMRGPRSHEADGRVVIERTVRQLIDAGLAVRVHHPSMDKTWVYSRSLYERTPAATASSASAATGSSVPLPPPTPTGTPSPGGSPSPSPES